MFFNEKKKNLWNGLRNEWTTFVPYVYVEKCKWNVPAIRHISDHLISIWQRANARWEEQQQQQQQHSLFVHFWWHSLSPVALFCQFIHEWCDNVIYFEWTLFFLRMSIFQFPVYRYSIHSKNQQPENNNNKKWFIIVKRKLSILLFLLCDNKYAHFHLSANKMDA